MDCSVPGCERPYYAKGLCNTHRKRFLRWGEVRPDVPVRQRIEATQCAVEACTRPRDGGRLCSGHRSRWYTLGDVVAEIPLGLMPRRPRPKTYTPCSVLGCTAWSRLRGMCPAHADRVEVYGDPLPELPLGGRPGRREALLDIVAKARAYDALMAMNEQALA
jgi:hypothetical protein